MDQPAPEPPAPTSEPAVVADAGGELPDPFREPAVPVGEILLASALPHQIRWHVWEQLKPLLVAQAETGPVLDISPAAAWWLASLLAAASLLLGTTLGGGSALSFTTALVLAMAVGVVVVLTSRDRTTTQSWNDQRLLAQWAEAYGLCYQQLAGSELPLTIMDDALWEQFLEGIAPSVREITLGHPHSFGERLVQAAALWEMLVGYHQERPDYSLVAVVECSARIHTLHSMVPEPGTSVLGGGSIRPHTALFARFAALYDFFNDAAATSLPDSAAPPAAA